MAKINGLFSFTGTLAGLTAYERKDAKGTFVRTSSSLTRERIYSDPAFENSLRNASEHGGRSKGAKWLRWVLQPLHPVRVGSWQGPITGALAPVQERDTDGAKGQRSVLFSRHGHLLEGLGLSRRTPLEELLRNPVSYTISKEKGQAEVTFPRLDPGVNLFLPTTYSLFRLVAVLGAVPDLFYIEGGYKPDGDFSPVFPQAAFSEWYGVKSGAPANTLPLQLTQPPPNDSFGLVLAAGILLGAVNRRGDIEAVGYSGSGKILAVR